jgi:hypothetical protein
MPQGPFGAKPPLGIIYNTSMNRPDAALALALLYGFEGKRESRMGSVCITGAGLNTAVRKGRAVSAGVPRRQIVAPRSWAGSQTHAPMVRTS